MNKKSNKLIEAFMGIKANDEKHPDKHDGHYHPCPRYDSSWDWLMSVVKKIVPPKGWHLSLIKYQTSVVDSLQTTKIEKVYEAVVEFIKQHSPVVK